MNKSDWLASRCPNEAPPKATAPTFWFAERGFENSRTPCICMDNPSGGDPIIIAQIEPNSFWPVYVNAMCDAATRVFRMADALSQRLGEPLSNTQELVEPVKETAKNEHVSATCIETHIDRENDFPACIHCGAEQP